MQTNSSCQSVVTAPVIGYRELRKCHSACHWSFSRGVKWSLYGLAEGSAQARFPTRETKCVRSVKEGERIKASAGSARCSSATCNIGNERLRNTEESCGAVTQQRIYTICTYLDFGRFFKYFFTRIHFKRTVFNTQFYSEMADSKHQVLFCNDSPKRVLVSVIKTTPIKPRAADSLMPTSPGFSDFMVYPWRWGENAHNVTLSPGSGSGTGSPTRSSSSPAETDVNSCPDPESLKVSEYYTGLLQKCTECCTAYCAYSQLYCKKKTLRRFLSRRMRTYNSVVVQAPLHSMNRSIL